MSRLLRRRLRFGTERYRRQRAEYRQESEEMRLAGCFVGCAQPAALNVADFWWERLLADEAERGWRFD